MIILQNGHQKEETGKTKTNCLSLVTNAQFESEAKDLRITPTY